MAGHLSMLSLNDSIIIFISNKIYNILEIVSKFYLSLNIFIFIIYYLI